jgi:hypothetical protein
MEDGKASGDCFYIKIDVIAHSALSSGTSWFAYDDYIAQ